MAARFNLLLRDCGSFSARIALQYVVQVGLATPFGHGPWLAAWPLFLSFGHASARSRVFVLMSATDLVPARRVPVV